MEDIEFTVEQAELSGWKFLLSVNVRGKYISTVRNPKITVCFDSGTQVRLVPLPIVSYTETGGIYLIYAQFSYDVRHLFYNEPLGEKITVRFAVMYGDTYKENVPFRLGEIVNRKYDNSSDDSDDADEEGEGEEKGDFYEVNLLPSKERIELLAKFSLHPVTRARRFLSGVQKFFFAVWTIILVLIGICLLPVFIVDAILALLGITPRNASIYGGNSIIYVIKHARWKLNSFCRVNFGILPFKLKFMQLVNAVSSLFSVKENRVVFLSNRRTDLSGNFEFVYEQLKKDESLDIRFVLDDHPVRTMKFSNMLRIAVYFANAKVILVDDYMELLFKMPRRKGTKLIQLWHACGAFKTFGCSRIGKSGGQSLKSLNHRSYDYATVSSKEIARFYAEGFGLSPEKVVATGVPRTDIFFDQAYKNKVTEEFYGKYPKLRDKKIILFAPTFRGNGKNTGYYPIELFDVNQLAEEIGSDYAIVIKHHPFVKNKTVIQKKYKNSIIDLSENSELNDLLFVTDLLITDYSSVVFEASLLRIPMLFYVFDLEQYIATRGFYYEFESFVPGKIVRHFDEVSSTILTKDFETEKIEAFRDRFFDDKDGKSTERTMDLIYRCLGKNRLEVGHDGHDDDTKDFGGARGA